VIVVEEEEEVKYVNEGGGGGRPQNKPLLKNSTANMKLLIAPQE
jgi:hypothetical protein